MYLYGKKGWMVISFLKVFQSSNGKKWNISVWVWKIYLAKISNSIFFSAGHNEKTLRIGVSETRKCQLLRHTTPQCVNILINWGNRENICLGTFMHEYVISRHQALQS